MKKNVLLAIIIITTLSFGAYNIGDIVNSSDNISWTDNFGYSSDIFTEISHGKPVVIFFGQTW